jgi:hypothetical protein
MRRIDRGHGDRGLQERQSERNQAQAYAFEDLLDIIA